MRNMVNSNLSCTGLVQRYIGSSYDLVAYVAEHIEDLRPLWENLGPDELKKLSDLAPEFKHLLDQLVFFHDRYYGALPTEPTLRPSGANSENGDLYFDLQKQSLMVRTGSTWVPATGTENTVEVITIGSSHIQGTNAVLTLTQQYDPGANNILVFVNGVFQYPITNITPNGAYSETDPLTLTFPNAEVQVGDIVTVLIGKAVTNTSQTVGVRVNSYRTIVDMERVIKLPGDMYYTPGINNLEVYVDGRLRTVGIDYFETDGQKITFANGLPTNSLITFKKGSVVATGQPGTAQPNVKISVLSTVGELNSITVPHDNVLLLRGYNTPGDGGSGVFVFNGALARSTANGGTTIDHTVTMAQQGTGIGNGLWVRQYADEIHAEWFGLDQLLMPNLMQITRPKHGDRVNLVGFHQPGDGGEGVFYWDENHPATEHDGGTVIDPRQPFPANWNNATQMATWFTPNVSGIGAWRRLQGDDASASWFGALGDGTTDNGLVFDGISAAVQNGHVKSLHVPAGDFVVSSAKALAVRALTTGFKMYGNGFQSILHMKVGAPSMPFMFTDCDHLTFQNLRFLDDRRTAGNDGLRLMNCSNVLVQGCQFDGISNYGIGVTKNTVAGTSTACDNIRITANQFIRVGPNGGSAIYCKPETQSRNIDIESNTLYYCGSPISSALFAGFATVGTVIRNNLIDGPLGKGIEVRSFENCVVSNNMIEDFGDIGIFVYAGSDPAYNTPSLVNCKVTENQIGFVNPTGTVGTYGVEVQGNINNVGFLEIDNNTLNACGGVLIDPQANLQNIVVTGNKIQNIPTNLNGLRVDSANGGGTDNIYLGSNYVENENVARNQVMVSLQQSQNAILDKNHIKRSGVIDIQLDNCPDSYVTNNTFYEPNMTNSATASIVSIVDPNTVNYNILGNQVLTGRQGHFVAWHDVATAPPTIRERNNEVM